MLFFSPFSWRFHTQNDIFFCLRMTQIFHGSSSDVWHIITLSNFMLKLLFNIKVAAALCKTNTLCDSIYIARKSRFPFWQWGVRNVLTDISVTCIGVWECMSEDHTLWQMMHVLARCSASWCVCLKAVGGLVQSAFFFRKVKSLLNKNRCISTVVHPKCNLTLVL